MKFNGISPRTKMPEGTRHFEDCDFVRFFKNNPIQSNAKVLKSFQTWSSVFSTALELRGADLHFYMRREKTFLRKKLFLDI
jgi:hypothetical protein